VAPCGPTTTFVNSSAKRGTVKTDNFCDAVAAICNYRITIEIPPTTPEFYRDCRALLGIHQSSPAPQYREEKARLIAARLFNVTHWNWQDDFLTRALAQTFAAGISKPWPQSTPGQP
jgi:hypothetical protein